MPCLLKRPSLALGALSLTVSLGAQAWQQRIVEAPGYPGSAALDEARGRLVMYAGATWEWDGFSWARRAPVPPNSGGPLAYDPVTQRVLMFGGFDVSQWQELNETWAWDGFSWEKLGASVAAAAGALGSGCLGSGGRVPVLDSLGLPRRDRPGFALDVGLIRANAPGALLLSAESSNQLLGGGCVLRVHLPTTLAVPFTSTVAGFFSQPLPLARTLPLGVGLFGQAVVIDPAGAFAGLVFTNGLQLTIGE